MTSWYEPSAAHRNRQLTGCMEIAKKTNATSPAVPLCAAALHTPIPTRVVRRGKRTLFLPPSAAGPTSSQTQARALQQEVFTLSRKSPCLRQLPAYPTSAVAPRPMSASVIYKLCSKAQPARMQRSYAGAIL